MDNKYIKYQAGRREIFLLDLDDHDSYSIKELFDRYGECFLHIGSRSDYEYTGRNIYVYRYETDQEYDDRIEQEEISNRKRKELEKELIKKKQEVKRQSEIKLYKQLKKKYGNIS